MYFCLMFFRYGIIRDRGGMWLRREGEVVRGGGGVGGVGFFF